MKLPSIETAVGQKALAFIAVWLGCIVMTILAAIAVYLVSGNVTYSFWLGMAAHAQIAMGLGVFGAHFVRRSVRIGKDGVEIADAAEVTTTTTVEVKGDV